MNLEAFFNRFDELADTPSAVAKMRELVLQLAVTGKLVAQDQRDEPASSLVESAEAERARLVAARKIKARPTKPVDSDEQPYDLPSSWAWARLSDVGHELGQKVPDKRFTYIDVGGIDSDKGRISDRIEKLEPGDAPSRARKLLARGTVIYSTVRPYLLNIAIVEQDFDPEPIASTAFGILHPFEGINNRFLFYWLRSAPFTAYVQAGMKGMAYPAIDDETFYRGPIALPPLAEQKRIVAKVDELMALCDRLEAQQEERETRHAALARASLARFADAPTPANLKVIFHSSYDITPADLRETILTMALRGKLVERIHDEGDGHPLLKKLASLPPERNSKSRTPKVLSIEPALPVDIPTHWAATTIEGTTRGNGFFGDGDWVESKDQDPEGDVRLIQLADVGDGVYRNRSSRFMTKEAAARLNCSFLQKGDLLVARMPDPLGRCCRFPGDSKQAVTVVDVCILRPNLSVMDPDFLVLAINCPAFRQLVGAQASGTTRSRISRSNLSVLPVPLPPIAEQRRIVAKVEQLMALVDTLESRLAASRTTAELVLEAVVAELTAPSGSAVQPAGVLA